MLTEVTFARYLDFFLPLSGFMRSYVYMPLLTFTCEERKEERFSEKRDDGEQLAKDGKK